MPVSLFFLFKKKKVLLVLKILGIPNRRVLYFYDFLYDQIIIVLTFNCQSYLKPIRTVVTIYKIK